MSSPELPITPSDHRAPLTPPPNLPLASPTFSSPGSLYRLGISPFSHRFSSSPPRTPPRKGSSDSSEQDDLAKDNRDVLVQRLADLMERVSGGGLRDEKISELHRRVDEMEDAVRGSKIGTYRKGKRSRPKSLDIDALKEGAIWSPVASPSALLRSGFSDPSSMREAALLGSPATSSLHRSRFSDSHLLGKPFLPPPTSSSTLLRSRLTEPIPEAPIQRLQQKHEKRTSVEDAARIAREAEQLNFHLATLITRLHARQEESEHIHGLLIERAEKAAQRIIVLEEQVQELTSTLEETTSDLSNLRIALKAIELQCPPPHNLDDDLRRSIQNWKADWKRLKEARAARLGREASFLSSPGTPW